MKCRAMRIPIGKKQLLILFLILGFVDGSRCLVLQCLSSNLSLLIEIPLECSGKEPGYQERK